MTTALRQGAVLLLSLMMSCPEIAGALAQPAAGAAPLDGKALSGMQLFNQHCRVCHTKPLLTSGQYGPILSQSSLGGDERALHDFIANGTPRMPGFKYSFAPAQLDAIVAYLKTVPAPATP
jgi:mono/diheme cytochrome c family protein